MKSAISVELDGATFALEDRAYDALRAYLDRAGARLGTQPERAEVIAGLERSIAAKLRSLHSPDAATLDEAAIQAVLKDVGRVDGPGLEDSGRRDASGRELGRKRRARRRLYRLRDGHQFAGVCAGLAAFAEVDVGLVRLNFVLATVLSGGIAALVYLLLMFAMPIADGPIAEARGRAVRGSPPSS